MVVEAGIIIIRAQVQDDIVETFVVYSECPLVKRDEFLNLPRFEPTYKLQCDILPDSSEAAGKMSDKMTEKLEAIYDPPETHRFCRRQLKWLRVVVSFVPCLLDEVVQCPARIMFGDGLYVIEVEEGHVQSLVQAECVGKDQRSPRDLLRVPIYEAGDVGPVYISSILSSALMNSIGINGHAAQRPLEAPAEEILTVEKVLFVEGRGGAD